jgi:hypothetical protein
LTLNESIEFSSPATTLVKQLSYGYDKRSTIFLFAVHGYYIISPTLKKQIIEGRDVNLAALLIKDNESLQAASFLLVRDSSAV